MQVKCYRCGGKFSAKRKTAKYCSDTCKTLYFRHGSLVNEQLEKAESAIAEICSLLDGDRKWWGRESHSSAMLIHEALSKLLARTDFLTQAELHDRYTE